MKRRKKPRASTRRPTYVGVDAICAALDISRPTLSRMREDGKFPEHEQISPNRIGWSVAVIKAHLAAQDCEALGPVLEAKQGACGGDL